MKILNIRIDQIRPYEKNPRINDEAVKYVANSIKEFGFKQPIVIDKNNVIVAGHTRYKAAMELGLESVPCIMADDLTDEQVKAYRLADNKVAEASEWDFDLLNNELEDIFDIDMEKFGFSIDEDEDFSEEKEKAEVEFTEVFNEENNYIILQFKNDIDWLQAQSVFDIKPKMAYSTRKDGSIGKSMRRVGVGRVLDGGEALKKIVGDLI